MHFSAYVILAGFVGGIFVAIAYDANLFFSVFLILVALILFTYKKNFLIIIFILSFSLGIFRTQFNNETFYLNEFVGREVKINGLITEEPDVRERNIHYVIEVEEIISPRQITNVHELIRVTTNRHNNFLINTEVYVRGKLEKPENFITNSGRTFDYINYLGRKKIYNTMKNPKIEITNIPNSFSFKEKLFSIKTFLIKEMKKILPSPHAELLAGMTLGVEQSLGKELIEAFRKTGLIHIVVLSGYIEGFIVFLHTPTDFIWIPVEF